MAYHDLETALQMKDDPATIVSLLQDEQDEDENFNRLLLDTYAYALNTSNQDLEDAILSAFPYLPTLFVKDKDFLEDLWIYARIYQRPDIDGAVSRSLNNYPWHKLLPIAITEDIDPLIQISLLEGKFDLEDLVLSLVAAHRLGNQEMINYLGAAVGPEWSELIEEGYVVVTLRGGEIPYRILFRE